MSTFPTLEEFLELPDSDGREYFLSLQGYQWVALYKIAKTSHRLYGDQGPPSHSQVITLKAGHGGPAGLHKIFLGEYKDTPKFFALGPISPQHTPNISLLFSRYWWREIVPKGQNEREIKTFLRYL